MISKKHKFHEKPALDAAIRSRGKAVFGEDWLEKCEFSAAKQFGGGEIECNNTVMGWGLDNGWLGTEVFVDQRAQDPDVGVPALVRFYDSGKMESLEHYAFGKHSCVRGEPSVINFWENGKTRKIQYKEGTKHINPPNGGPATVNFKPDGTIESGTTLSGGSFRILSAEETAAMMKNAREFDMAKLCDAEVVVCGRSNLGTNSGTLQQPTRSP